MKKISILTIFLICITLSCYAQHQRSNFYNNKLTIEPGVGTRFVSLGGSTIDVQPAVFVQYNLHPRVSFMLHSTTSFDIKSPRFKNIKTDQNFTSSQRIGVGTTLFSRKTANSFFLAGGAKHYRYSASMNNKNLTETVDVEIDKWYADWGILYAFKWGRKRTFFSSRIYLPLSTHETGYTLLENTTIEFGVGLKIK